MESLELFIDFTNTKSEIVTNMKQGNEKENPNAGSEAELVQNNGFNCKRECTKAHHLSGRLSSKPLTFIITYRVL